MSSGTVDHVDISSNPVHAGGHTNITSPALPLKFNLDPATIIQLLAIRASQKGVNLGPLTELFQIVLSNPNFHPPVRTLPDSHALFLIMTCLLQITTSVDPNPPTCVRFACLYLVFLVMFNKHFIHSGQQFDVNDAILNALAGLEVTLDVDSVVKLDDFETELVFKQFNVPAIVSCLNLVCGLIS